jgi:hypothetical protein
MKGESAMKESYIKEITEILNTLDESQLLYLLSFINQIFGSR